MAAPAEISVNNLSGRWSINSALSDSYDTILKAQDVSWLTRKMVTAGTLTLTIQQMVDGEGLTHLTIESKSSTGLPPSKEQRLLNNETRHATHPLFGKITGRTQWVSLADLPSKWLATGWEESTTKVILMTTEHLDVGAVTYQANGIAVIGGARHYVRHIEVQKGTERVEAKLIYDYLSPLEA